VVVSGVKIGFFLHGVLVWLVVVNPDHWHVLDIEWVGPSHHLCKQKLAVASSSGSASSKNAIDDQLPDGLPGLSASTKPNSTLLSLYAGAAKRCFKGMGKTAMQDLAREHNIKYEGSELFDILLAALRHFLPGLDDEDYSLILELSQIEDLPIR